MRIVLVNWARIWDGATHGGGVNQYCQSLALELIERGHEVVSLFGGTTYVPPPHCPASTTPGRGACVIRRHDDWLGVKVFEVINSPVLAPSIRQFADPLGEVSAPELEEQVERLMRALTPDAVHWNNIEGFSAGCVDAVRRACPGARQVFSLHNYHTVCPQVYFMQGHTRACWGYDNGHACATCIGCTPTEQHRVDLERAWVKSAGGVSAKPSAVPMTWRARASRAFREWRVASTTLVRDGLGIPPGTLSGKTGEAGAEVAAPLEMPGRASPIGGASGSIGLPVLQVQAPTGGDAADKRGKTAQLLAELNPWRPPTEDDPERRPLLNEVRPELASERAPNAYAARRAAMVGMLNSCDRVLAVSDFVRRKFESLGVEAGRVRTLTIGTRMHRVIALKPELLFEPPRMEERPTPWWTVRPLRLLFMGYNNYYKGLHILAEALDAMPATHARQIDLSVHALDGQSIEWMFRRLEPRLARLKFGYAYTSHDVPWMMGGKDLTVVPSVWWDNGPQTVMESLTCGVPVLGAAVGGIPDFVRHGENGLLFTGNSVKSLRDTLVAAVEDPWSVERLRAGVTRTKSMTEHAAEMEAVYAGRE